MRPLRTRVRGGRFTLPCPQTPGAGGRRHDGGSAAAHFTRGANGTQWPKVIARFLHMTFNARVSTAPPSQDCLDEEVGHVDPQRLSDEQQVRIRGITARVLVPLNAPAVHACEIAKLLLR